MDTFGLGKAYVLDYIDLSNNSIQELPLSFSTIQPDTTILSNNEFVNYIKTQFNNVETGEFGLDMDIKLVNDGPVTFIVEI